MTALLCVYLNRWDSDLVRRRRKIEPARAIILALAERQRDVVAGCCEKAESRGVQRGMTIAHARALAPGAHIEPIDEVAHARLLRRLAQRMHRFVPVVAIDGADGLLLDARGCEGIYGSTDRLLMLVRAHLEQLGLSARLAAAPTWAGARAIARFGPRPLSVTTPPLLRRTLAELPVEALGIEPGVIERLGRVGVLNIGQLMVLPRASLGARYGADVLLRLDQALGEAIETVELVRAQEPVEAERLLDGPTDRPEDIEAVVREVIEQMCVQLRGRGLGGRWWELTLRRSDLEPLVLVAPTSRPTGDARHVCGLFRHRLESAPLGFGIEGVRGRVRVMARRRDEQQSAWERGQAEQDRVGKLIDTLTARLGNGCVRRPRVVASHMPERAAAYERVDQLDERLDLRRYSRDAAQRAEEALPDRPSVLREARPTDVSLLLPDGPIAAVRVGGRMSRVIGCVGPERIESEWWRRPGPGRDYFKVQTEDGRWVWIYREVESARWFVQGEWG
ncbi:MAG: DNA polymerase Y family protein [Phycisphaerales bacterium]|nr:DNA polymerase Y family protein [Phycisphaerales bacterium]